MGGLGWGIVPILEPAPKSETTLRREQSFEDLLRAADKRERRDQFTRRQNEPEAALPKKRSKIKRAFNQVLIALHLKRKPQPPAPAVVEPETVSARQNAQDDVPLSPVSLRSVESGLGDSVQSDELKLLPSRHVRFVVEEDASPAVKSSSPHHRA
jgi:hypothetical protein